MIQDCRGNQLSTNRMLSERCLRMLDWGGGDKVGVCVTAPLTLLFEAHE